MKQKHSLNITWYGRCCFLVKYQNKSILFDPYDTYCNVDIGYIDADILISSSTWHDHGHIGASPQAYICTNPGLDIQGDIKIIGIEAKEDRGTPTIVFNVSFGPYSITNFADFGPEQKNSFDKSLTSIERDILQTTNIAFVRASIIGDKIKKNNTHNENFLDYCQPKVIFPEHYFPRSFTKKHVPDSKKEHFYKPVTIVDEMIEKLAIPVKEINGWTTDILLDEIKDTTFFRFSELYPQVIYKKINSN